MNQLILGDCLEVMKRMDKRINNIFTDTNNVKKRPTYNQSPFLSGYYYE